MRYRRCCFCKKIIGKTRQVRCSHCQRFIILKRREKHANDGVTIKYLKDIDRLFEICKNQILEGKQNERLA